MTHLVWRYRSFLLPLAGFAAMGALPLIFSEPFFVGALTLAFLGGAASLAWNLSGGYAGQLSLGHAAFYGIGAYTTTILFLKSGISPLIGIWVGVTLSALMAVLLGAVTMRLKGSFFVMSTLAFGAVVHISAINLRDLTGGASGLAIPLRPNLENLIFAKKIVYTYLALGLVVIFYCISRVIAASKIGYALVAFRENHDAARALGIRTLPLRIGVFALSAGLTSICGTLHAQYYLYIDPDSVMGLSFSLNLALMAILGGIGTAYGPIIGALLVSAVSLIMQVYLADQISGLTQLAYAAIVIVVLLAAPKGIGPSIHALLKRRVAWLT
jgi:branched-chain amino acid transport system permease protein